MALYVPEHFAARDDANITRLIDQHPFATLVTPVEGDAQVTHLPLLRDGERALIGHVARANPHARAFSGRASFAIFHGPHAYVSPTWYAEPQRAVPTWNFATVHVHGRITVLDDAAEHEATMLRLVAHFEGEGPAAWRFALTGPQRAAMLAAIVVFRMTVERIEAKFKLSQNRSAGDRTRVADALANRDDADSHAVAAWMAALAPRPDDRQH